MTIIRPPISKGPQGPPRYDPNNIPLAPSGPRTVIYEPTPPWMLPGYTGPTLATPQTVTPGAAPGNAPASWPGGMTTPQDYWAAERAAMAANASRFSWPGGTGRPLPGGTVPPRVDPPPGPPSPWQTWWDTRGTTPPTVPHPGGGGSNGWHPGAFLNWWKAQHERPRYTPEQIAAWRARYGGGPR